MRRLRLGSTPALLTLLANVLLTAWLLPAAARAVTPFNRTVSLQGVSFQVQSSGDSSQQVLTITAEGTRQPIAPIRLRLEGRVVGTEVADLNGNGQPEIYVFVQKGDSGSQGDLVAYALINGSRLTPITVETLSGNKASGLEGYRGNDSFQLMEGCLVRRFPVYRPGDTDARATGGERQICYELEGGDSTPTLRASAVMTVSSP